MLTQALITSGLDATVRGVLLDVEEGAIDTSETPRA